VQLVSKISNLCNHKSPTSHTDGQTDGQTDRQTDDMRSHRPRKCTKVHCAIKMLRMNVKNICLNTFENAHLKCSSAPFTFLNTRPRGAIVSDLRRTILRLLRCYRGSSVAIRKLPSYLADDWRLIADAREWRLHAPWRTKHVSLHGPTAIDVGDGGQGSHVPKNKVKQKSGKKFFGQFLCKIRAIFGQ